MTAPRNDLAGRVAEIADAMTRRVAELEATIRLADPDVDYECEQTALEELLPFAGPLAALVAGVPRRKEEQP